ncbi:MAG: hypothetical protein EXS36_12870 [Pedosphaera sp.]|nr:hypothetical protein [Pedosphaera sp.]
MPKPKKKLLTGSTKTFLIGRGVLGDEKTSVGVGEDDGAFLLAIHRSTQFKAFLKKDSSKRVIAEILLQPPGSIPGQALLGFMYSSMVSVIATPEEALQDNRADVRCLRSMLTHYPDFAIELLVVLRRVFVKHQKKQPDIERAILALRLRKDVTDSFGKSVGFDVAQYKEIQSAHGIDKETWRDAVAYLDGVDNRR